MSSSPCLQLRDDKFLEEELMDRRSRIENEWNELGVF